jgi:hypothetical protein
MSKMWKCPKCDRRFEKKNQSHSCRIYPFHRHFEGKENAKPLYKDLTEKMKKKVGPFRVDSVHCCIHFVTSFTFAAVYIMKDKIRVSFASNHKLKSRRIMRSEYISANRYTNCVDVKDKREIDIELLAWIKEAYNIRKK